MARETSSGGSIDGLLDAADRLPGEEEELVVQEGEQAAEQPIEDLPEEDFQEESRLRRLGSGIVNAGYATGAFLANDARETWEDAKAVGRIPGNAWGYMRNNVHPISWARGAWSARPWARNQEEVVSEEAPNGEYSLGDEEGEQPAEPDMFSAVQTRRRLPRITKKRVGWGLAAIAAVGVGWYVFANRSNAADWVKSQYSGFMSDGVRPAPGQPPKTTTPPKTTPPTTMPAAAASPEAEASPAPASSEDPTQAESPLEAKAQDYNVTLPNGKQVPTTKEYQGMTWAQFWKQVRESKRGLTEAAEIITGQKVDPKTAYREGGLVDQVARLAGKQYGTTKEDPAAEKKRGVKAYWNNKIADDATKAEVKTLYDATRINVAATAVVNAEAAPAATSPEATPTPTPSNPDKTTSLEGALEGAETKTAGVPLAGLALIAGGMASVRRRASQVGGIGNVYSPGMFYSQMPKDERTGALAALSPTLVEEYTTRTGKTRLKHNRFAEKAIAKELGVSLGTVQRNVREAYRASAPLRQAPLQRAA